MRVATLTTWIENVRGAEKGNHKGCPYDRSDGAIFRGTWNENVRGAEKGNHKGCPYGKVGDGLFS